MAAVQLIPSAERQRIIKTVAFAPGSIASFEIPKDSVYKSFQIRLSGSIVTTFASGTPVADSMSTMANLIPRIDIFAGQNRLVKSVNPHLMAIQQLFSTTVRAERRSSAGAAAATDNFPTADGGFAYGTTGQTTTVAESITISFEMVYANQGMGRDSTWLNLKNASSSEMRMQFAAYSSLLGFGNTAPVVFSASTLQVEVTSREAMDIPAEVVFADWKETTKSITVQSEQREFAIDINKGNYLTGIMLFARDGAAGTATTATGKLPSNLLIGNIKLVLNGRDYIKSTNFKNLQSENRSQYGCNAPFASNVSVLDGIAHLNLLAAGNLKTALPVKMPAVDSVQLVIDTASSSNVSYTNPAEIMIMTQELVLPS